ncbi:hypothetical protein MKW92_050120, partial [Papaver armeniacum]
MAESIVCHLGSGRDDFLVQLKMGKMSNKLLIEECLFMVMNYARWIYDRGKVFDILKEYFYFAVTSKFDVDTITSCELVFDVWIFISIMRLPGCITPDTNGDENQL